MTSLKIYNTNNHSWNKCKNYQAFFSEKDIYVYYCLNKIKEWATTTTKRLKKCDRWSREETVNESTHRDGPD